MPKKWLQPYIAILESHSEAWRNAKGKPERKAVIKLVVDAITEQEDDLPDELDDVCILHYCGKVNLSDLLV
jgi:hypothetical protein